MTAEIVVCSTCKFDEDRKTDAQGMTGIVNAKRIWQLNQKFWADKKLPLKQEMIFASTGTKKPEDPAWKYVEAFAGSDIETNPPATNDAVLKSDLAGASGQVKFLNNGNRAGAVVRFFKVQGGKYVQLKAGEK